MNIGFVLPEVGLKEEGVYVGGHVNNVVEVSRELYNRGHTIHIITTKPRNAIDNPTKEISWANVHVHDPYFRYGSPGYGVSFITYSVCKINQLYSSGDLDVVSIHSGYPILGLISQISNGVFGCPTAHVQYCPLEEKSGSYSYDLLQSKNVSKYYLSNLDQLIGISPNTSRSLKDIAPSSAVKTITPGIDTDEYHPDSSKRSDYYKSDEFVISYMGSLKPQKGLDLLVDAFDEFNEDHHSKLLLALEARSSGTKNDLMDKINSHPDIHSYDIVNDVPAFLAASDIFVVPFRTTMGPADYPISALEAMACGTPVVVTNVGGLYELTKTNETGIAVEHADVESVYSGINDMYDLNYSDMGLDAREFIIDNFSISEVAREHEETLLKLI